MSATPSTSATGTSRWSISMDGGSTRFSRAGGAKWRRGERATTRWNADGRTNLHSSSRRTPGPIATRLNFAKTGSCVVPTCALSINHAVWVPAFAGTTVEIADRPSPEPHPDSLFLAPDHGAGEMCSVGLDEQAEMVGDADGTADVECGAGIGQVADSAVDRAAAAELDRSGLQHAMPCLVAPLVHGDNLYPKLIKTLNAAHVVMPLRRTRGQRPTAPAAPSPSAPSARRL